jgi:hypothetical protein
MEKQLDLWPDRKDEKDSPIRPGSKAEEELISKMAMVILRIFRKEGEKKDEK